MVPIPGILSTEGVTLNVSTPNTASNRHARGVQNVVTAEASARCRARGNARFLRAEAVRCEAEGEPSNRPQDRGGACG